MRVVSNVCRECPFKRDAAPGWLGAASFKPVEFLAPHWANDVPLPCHLQIDWDSENSAETLREAHLCKGYLTMLANQHKLPRDTEQAELVNITMPDRDNVFAHQLEFVKHHTPDWDTKGEPYILV